MFSRASGPKQKNLFLGIMGLALVFSPWAFYLPMQTLLYSMSGHNDRPIETIVILGRGFDTQSSRARAAAQYWQTHPTANIFVSGMTDTPEIIKMLKTWGVPSSKISGERCSQTTWENGLFSDLLLDADHKKRILLVTDSPHMVRSVWVFKGFGFEQVEPYPTEPKMGASLSLRQVQIMLREYAALVAYGISGKYRPEAPEQKQQSEAEARDKLKGWGCRIRR